MAGNCIRNSGFEEATLNRSGIVGLGGRGGQVLLGVRLSDFFSVAFLIGLAGLVGCSPEPTIDPVAAAADTEALVDDWETQAIAEQVENEKPEAVEHVATAQSENVLSEEQISILFGTTWVADREATVAFANNSGRELLKEKAELYCSDLKMNGYFKDEGFKVTEEVNHKSFIIPLNYKSDSLAESFRMIDDTHFAIYHNELWLVFKEIEI